MSISVPTSSPPAGPLRERFNLRVLVFAGVFLALIGWVVYLAADTALSGGVKNRGEYFEVDLKAMSDFRFSQTDGTIDDVPKQWRELNNKTVVLVGEIAPTGQKALGDADQFDLVYSVQNCCFGGPPQIQHFVKVTVPRSATFQTNSPVVRVKGTLKVNVTRDPQTGTVTGVYSVVADGVTSV